MSKSVPVVLPVCKFDGYECFRNLCCFSRFFSDFRCSRFVVIRRGSFTPHIPKDDFQRRRKGGS